MRAEGEERINSLSFTTDISLENSSSNPDYEPLWTVDEVAQFLNFKPGTIREMARKGKLPAIKVGREWRFRKVSLHNFLDELNS
jgi:excisionase family DNA binding protein